MTNQTITAVDGVRVGHAVHPRGGTGCTVLLGPFRGACDVRGMATGTRELDTLSLTHLVPRVDAVLLTGGSAFGLAAADGVMRWVAEQGGGFDTGVARVPIVPAAVIFDLGDEPIAPDASTGYQACLAATEQPVAEGRVGAGTGASIGKLRGRAHADRGGVGSFAVRAGAFTVGALAVVNSLGDVLDFDGSIVAGTRAADGRHLNSMKAVTEMALEFPPPANNTTIAAIVTDAPLSRVALQTIARAASCGIVRRIAPTNTVFDGDVVFALSTAADVRDTPAPELLALGAAAQLALEHSILRAARAGHAS